MNPGNSSWKTRQQQLSSNPQANSRARKKTTKKLVQTPDELDILVTSKNHEMKTSVAKRTGHDDWIFALVTLQTMSGFMGAGNYGISRMNGGFGSRPAFSLTPEGNPGRHFRYDLRTILKRERRIATEYPMRPGLLGLTWTLPWDGQKQLTLDQLDPMYIEVCRRIRLDISPQGQLYAKKANSTKSRINAKDINGRTGDPWTPINVKEQKSLTPGAEGFTYQKIVEYMKQDGEWQLPLLWEPERGQDGNWTLIARALAGGQGETQGYHERRIPLRPKVISNFRNRTGRTETEAIAQDHTDKIAATQRILSDAIQTYLNSGNSEGATQEHRENPKHRENAKHFLNKLDQMVDQRFFEDLQDELERTGEERRNRNIEWQKWLGEQAREQLQAAQASLSTRVTNRQKARVLSNKLFEMRIRGENALKEAYEITPPKETKDE